MLSRIRRGARVLASIEIAPVALAIAASVSFKTLLPYALGVAALFWLVRLLAYGRLTVRTPADWPVVMMALLVPVTLWTTAYLQVTLPEVCRLLTGIALYYAIVNWATSPRKLRWLVTGLAAAGLLLALSGLVMVDWLIRKEVIFSGSVYEQLPAPVPQAMHPNTMGAVLAILCAMVSAMLLFAWHEHGLARRILSGFAVTGMVAVLLLTQSRGGLLGLAIALTLVIALRWHRGWLVFIPLGLAGVAAICVPGPRNLLEFAAVSGAMRSLQGRIEVWLRAIYAIEDFPLTGVGMGTFGWVASVLYPFSTSPVSYTHNLFLQVGVDLGLPGVVAWLAILILILVSAWELYRQGRNRGNLWAAGLGAGLLGSQTALVVHGMVDATSWITWAMVVVWGLWGIAMAGERVLGEQI